MCGVIVYVANIVKGLRVVSSGAYNVELVEGELAIGVKGVDAGQERPLGRDDSLKVLAASNTILALVLVGVLVLQAGQWYAERKEGQEVERIERVEREEREKKAASAGGGGGGGGGGLGAAQRGGSGSKKKV